MSSREFDRLGLLALVLVLWTVLSKLSLVSPLFLASPGGVVNAFLDDLQSGRLGRDLAATALRIIAGFGLGALLGVALGATVASSKRLSTAAAPFVDFARSVPVTALLPLFLLMFGIGSSAKVAAIAWSSGLVMMINTILGFENVPPARLNVGRLFGLSRPALVRQIVLPDAAAQVFVGLRTAVSLAVVVGIVSEMLLSTGDGIGGRLYDASVLYDTDRVYLGIILAGTLGYLFNLTVAVADRRVVHWRGR